MTQERDPEAWKVVYEATTPAELAAAYADWSNHYDRETLRHRLHATLPGHRWLARHVPKGAGPVLDAGCGTGLSGPFVRALGYDRLEGLDLSPDMLALAGARGAYANLTQAELGRKLPWPDGHFAAFFSTGVFTEGHAPASGLDELVRITQERRPRHRHRARHPSGEARLQRQIRRTRTRAALASRSRKARLSAPSCSPSPTR